MHKIFTDGGSRGNPGNAASAFAIYKDGNLIDLGGEFLGTQTNNVAEYSALILALTHTLKLGVTQVECYLDSELVVKQLTGVYKVKESKVLELYNKVKSLINKFSNISFTHVPREQNAIADKLVNLILDAKA